MPLGKLVSYSQFIYRIPFPIFQMTGGTLGILGTLGATILEFRVSRKREFRLADSRFGFIFRHSRRVAVKTGI